MTDLFQWKKLVEARRDFRGFDMNGGATANDNASALSVPTFSVAD